MDISKLDGALLRELDASGSCEVTVRLLSKPTTEEEAELKALGARGRGQVWSARIDRRSVDDLSHLPYVARIQAAQRLRALS